MSLFDFSSEDNKVEESNGGWSPMKPGIHKVEMIEVALDDDMNLDFKFKGTTAAEAGNFNFRVWANKFDTSAENYNAKFAEWERNKVVHIVRAYLTEAESESIIGKEARHPNWGAFARSVMKGLIPDKYKSIQADLKVLIHYNDKFNEKYNCYETQIPMFPPFLSTDLKPAALRVNDKLNNKGEPLERIKPLSEYGIGSTSEAPEGVFNDASDVNFGGFGG